MRDKYEIGIVKNSIFSKIGIIIKYYKFYSREKAATFLKEKRGTVAIWGIYKNGKEMSESEINRLLA